MISVGTDAVVQKHYSQRRHKAQEIDFDKSNCLLHCALIGPFRKSTPRLNLPIRSTRLRVCLFEGESIGTQRNARRIIHLITALVLTPAMQAVLDRLIDNISTAPIDSLPGDNILIEDVFPAYVYTRILALRRRLRCRRGTTEC